MNPKITAFTCDKDLKKYTDSLLFDSGTVVAAMTIEDPQGYSVDMKIVVVGKPNVVFNGETYTSPEDFPPELIQAIKDGQYDETFIAESNNWFELNYSLLDEDGETYDCDVWEADLSSMTAQQVKEEMFQAGVSFVEYTLRDNIPGKQEMEK